MNRRQFLRRIGQVVVGGVAVVSLSEPQAVDPRAFYPENFGFEPLSKYKGKFIRLRPDYKSVSEYIGKPLKIWSGEIGTFGGIRILKVQA